MTVVNNLDFIEIYNSGNSSVSSGETIILSWWTIKSTIKMIIKY